MEEGLWWCEEVPQRGNSPPGVLPSSSLTPPQSRTPPSSPPRLLQDAWGGNARQEVRGIVEEGVRNLLISGVQDAVSAA